MAGIRTYLMSIGRHASYVLFWLDGVACHVCIIVLSASPLVRELVMSHQITSTVWSDACSVCFQAVDRDVVEDHGITLDAWPCVVWSDEVACPEFYEARGLGGGHYWRVDTGDEVTCEGCGAVAFLS